MKKLFVLMQFTVSLVIFSTSIFASGGEHHKRHHENRGHHHYQSRNDGFYPHPHQDPRSTQGLAGGVVGSVLGYQLGNGDPIVTGLGAAAGSYLGNGMAGGR
jgi:hypothetical protein